MACSCGSTYHNSTCAEYLQAASFCVDPCVDPNPCVEQISTDCIIYSGPDLSCYGIQNGMSLTVVLDILLDVLFPPCTTTTTSTTTTTTINPALTTTSTTSTTTTTTLAPTTTTTSTSTTTTTTLDPNDCVCYRIKNPLGNMGNPGAVIYPCGGGILEVTIPAGTTANYCVVNGTVPYPQNPSSPLEITPCGISCSVDPDCAGC